MKSLLKLAIVSILIILIKMPVYAQWSINEGFEDGVISSGWTIYDENDDGDEWFAYENSSHAHTGSWCATVASYGSDGDDWLVTPAVTIQPGDVFSFYAKAWTSTENMKVLLSTTTNTVSAFNVTLESVVGLGTNYVEYSYDLSAYAGQTIYLAIQWEMVTYALVVDDIKVGQAEPNDVGMLSIEIPEDYYRVNSEIYPSGTIQNFGSSDVTSEFKVICDIYNKENTLSYTDTLTYSGTLTADATDEVTFTQSWVPVDTGIYSCLIYTYLEGDGYTNNDSITNETEIVLHYGTGGPDDMGYRWVDSEENGGPVYDWVEISNTGTSAITYNVPSFYGDDNFSEPIPIGFDFLFYGIYRSHFYVDVNGDMLLADNTMYEAYPEEGWNNDGFIFNYSYPVPGFTYMPALIAPYWDDLYADEGVGDVYFQTFGEEPNRYCVIEWYNLRYAYGTNEDTTLTFEAILHENGDIIFQYKNVVIGNTGSAVPHDYGQSTTIGIQNDEADAGLCYLTEIIDDGVYVGIEPPGNKLKNEMAIKFYMGEDNQAPLIVYDDEIWNTFNTWSDTITVKITDASGVYSDTLYYNTGSGWQTVTYCSFEEPNIYSYQLTGLSHGQTVNYYFAATDNSSNQNRSTLPENAPDEYYTFKILPTEGVELLLATPGNRTGYEDYKNLEFPKYTAAFDSIGISYDVYNWKVHDEYDIPSSYKTIFVYSNNTQYGYEQDTLSLALMNFLDEGTNEDPKNIFMASDQFASARHSISTSRPFNQFFTSYIRGGYEPQVNAPTYGGSDGIGGPDIISYSEGSFIGVEDSPIGTEDVEIPVYSNSPDVIYNRSCPDWAPEGVTNPDSSSHIAFLFEDGPYSGDAYSKGNGCGLWFDNGIYKSFFISFDISQFTNDDDINNMLFEALEWFGETHKVTLSANPEEWGTVIGEGIYPNNSTVSLTATAASGYRFVNWTEDSTEVSTDATYSFTITEDRNLVANFSESTSINNIEQEIPFNIYPNPASDIITFETQGESKFYYEIISITGTIVMQGVISDNKKQLDISQIPSGTYLVRINNTSGFNTARFIKQ